MFRVKVSFSGAVGKRVSGGHVFLTDKFEYRLNNGVSVLIDAEAKVFKKDGETIVELQEYAHKVESNLDFRTLKILGNESDLILKETIRRMKALFKEGQLSTDRIKIYRRLMAIYTRYLQVFPYTRFNELLLARYGVPEVRLMTVQQLQHLLEFMESSLTPMEAV